MKRMPAMSRRLFAPVIFLSLAILSACAPLPLGIPENAEPVSQAARPVLIVNSDRNISRYEVPAASFARAVRGHPIVRLDLHGRNDPVETLQDYLNAYPIAGVYAVGAKALGAVNYLAPEMPVVFSAVMAWREFLPESNAYGIASDIAPDAQLLWFKHFFPRIKRLGVLYSDANQPVLESARSAATHMDLHIVAKRIPQSKMLATQAQNLLNEVDALWLISDPLVLSSAQGIENLFTLADSKQVPIFTYKRLFVNYGATLSITADEATTGRQAAVTLMQLMRKDKQLPAIQYPAGSSLTLNMDKVRRYQLHLNPAALDAVSDLVESTP